MLRREDYELKKSKARHGESLEGAAPYHVGHADRPYVIMIHVPIWESLLIRESSYRSSCIFLGMKHVLFAVHA